MKLLFSLNAIDYRFGRPTKTTLKPRSGKEYHQIGFFMDGDLKVDSIYRNFS